MSNNFRLNNCPLYPSLLSLRGLVFLAHLERGKMHYYACYGVRYVSKNIFKVTKYVLGQN